MIYNLRDPASFCAQHPCITYGSQVVDGEIRNISLSEYRGKYVVLFFYPKASFCTPRGAVAAAAAAPV